MNVFDIRDLAPTPWKNGGGRTREIARGPANSTLESLSWRVSIAEVHQSGPFSAYPGIDRVIAMLDGAGMLLEIDDGRVHDLTTPYAPFRFRGEDAVHARVIGEGGSDINLMLRRDVVCGEMEVLRQQRHLVWQDAVAAVLYCPTGSWLITTTGGINRVLVGKKILVDDAPTGITSILPLEHASIVVCITVRRKSSEEGA